MHNAALAAFSSKQITFCTTRRLWAKQPSKIMAKQIAHLQTCLELNAVNDASTNISKEIDTSLQLIVKAVYFSILATRGAKF